MMFVHNRIGIALVAAALVLAGFGCGQQDRLPPGGNGATEQPGTTQPGGTTGGTTDGTTDVTTMTWVEYRSPTLGITIPYPEGWTVRARGDGRAVDFHQGAPPEMSDAPSDFWSETQSNTLEAALAGFLAIIERTQVTRSARTMTRVVYPYDSVAAPDVRMVAYLWEENGVTHMLGGPEESAILEYVVSHLEVR